MKYLVEIIPESITDMDAAASKLAAALKLEPAKAAALLKRNPVTKPVSLAEAEKVAKLFNKAGIEVFVQNEEEYARTASTSQPQAEVQHFKQADSVPVVSKPAQPITEPKPLPNPPPTEQQTEISTVVQAKRTDPGRATPKSIVPETEPAQLADPFQTKTVQGGEPLNIPSGFFTPVPEETTVPAEGSDLSLVAEMAPHRSSDRLSRPSGSGKIAFASIVPGLLALLGIGAALYLVGLPFLRTQEHTSATTTAVALANSLGGWIGDVSLDNPTLSQQVQTVINRTQSELSAQGIDLVLLTDAEGNQLAGWYNETQGVPETLALSEAVKAQISAALAGATTTGESNTAPAQLTLQNEVLGLASAAVRQGDGAGGAVVVGRSEQPLMAKLQGLLPTLGLAGVLPLVLGMVVSFLVGRNR
jgi:hypothetical protein